jgi:hypothetical protein
METWKQIPKLEGWYSAGDHGIIRADYALAGLVDSGMTRKLARRGGTIRGSVSGNGHLQFVARQPDGRRVATQVHVAVAAAFLGPKPEGHEVNHRNGIKSDNRPANLEYVTHAANMLHAAKTLGAMARAGESNGTAKVNAPQVRVIRRLLAASASRAVIADIFAVKKHVVDQIASGRTWLSVAA